MLGPTPDAVDLEPPHTLPVHCQTATAMTVEPSILEVKRPYTAKEVTVEQAACTLKNFYICKFANKLNNTYSVTTNM